MKPVREKNTKEKGLVEFLVYPEGDTFVGVCLTFDIIEEGKNPALLMESIKEAAQLHLEVVLKENMSDDLLNRYAPEEYWDKYFVALRDTGEEDISSYFQRNPYSRVLSICTP
jgi:predicted RNase H-like HicB family nuclease